MLDNLMRWQENLEIRTINENTQLLKDYGAAQQRTQSIKYGFIILAVVVGILLLRRYNINKKGD